MTRGERLWHADVPGVPGAAEGGDVFGWSMATGDLNADGHLDLAVGAPGEVIGARTFTSGAVTVLYGSSGGLTSRGAQAGIRAPSASRAHPSLRTGSFGT